MDTAVFRRFCSGLQRLSMGQMRALRARLGELDARLAVLSRIDARGDATRVCVHCGGSSLQRWGETGTGLRRWRCKTCERGFSATTGTVLAGIRQPAKFSAVLDDMLSGQPSSCRALAERLGIDKTTVWRWRIRILQALSASSAGHLEGIVEVDEKFFREARKASREWVRHQRDPDRCPAPPRPRWRDFGRLGRLFPAGLSKWQVPVLTMADRGGAKHAEMLPDRRAETLIARLDIHVGQDAVLCSDGDSAYRQFARNRGIPHYRLKPKQGQRVIQKAFHIQNVNNLHGRFEQFMKPFRGPATRYLPTYTTWFLASLAPTAQIARDQAWKMILAA